MPKIAFKTITQQNFELEVDDSSTIAQIKQQISKEKGVNDFPVDAQKLIFNGKVLEDDKLVSELDIAPTKFIVVMVIKKQSQKSSQGAPLISEIASTTTTSVADEDVTTQVKIDSANKAMETSTSGKVSVPVEHLPTLENIEAMGYSREEAIRALQAAFYNADRAVEYLCNGIPEGLNLNQEIPIPADDEAGNEEGENEGNLNEGLEFLANNPQFQQLREMVHADPSTLPQIISQIAETNPALMDLIRNQQEQFLQLLNTEPAAVAGDAAQAQVSPAGNMPTTNSRRIAIPVTPEERNAIVRLTSMGFPEFLVVEAYFACDKNEDLAVNYMLQRMEEIHGEINRETGGD